MKKKRLKQIRKFLKRKHKITLDELFTGYTGNYKAVKEMYKDIMTKAANDPGFIERCEVISKDFEQIDYLQENFERNWEDKP